MRQVRVFHYFPLLLLAAIFLLAPPATYAQSSDYGGGNAQPYNYGGAPSISVRDCSGKVSGWYHPEEPACKRWIILWRDPDGNIYGESWAKSREGAEQVRDYNMRLFAGSPLEQHYRNPSAPICDACINTLPSVTLENIGQALERFEILLLKADLALSQVLKEVKTPAEGVGYRLSGYAQALAHARKKMEEVKQLLVRTDRAGGNINATLERALQELDSTIALVSQTYEGLPAGDVERLHRAELATQDYKETAQQLINEGRNEEAASTIKEGIRQYPNSATALTYNNLGMAYQRLGRFPEAVEAFQVALRMQPGLAPAYYNLGSTYIMMNRNEDAVNAELAAIRLQPNFAEAHNQLGLAYANLGRYSEAIAAFNKTISLIPQADVPHFNLAMTYLKQGNREAALQQYNALKQMNSKMAQNLYDAIYQKGRQGDVPYVLVPSEPRRPK